MYWFKISIHIIPAKNQQWVRLSVVILFDWFSKTKATVLKRSAAKRVRVVCVHARQGRDSFGCFLVLL